MDNFEELVKIFEDFPGIGPRQARRFAYYVISRDSSFSSKISDLISKVKNGTTLCKECMRFTNRNENNLCKICLDQERDKNTVLLVAKDSDLISIEKSDAFKGVYFVLGGLIPILEKNPEKRIRLKEFMSFLEKKSKTGISEIILGLSATGEGENTTEYIKTILNEKGIKYSELGRGISTGSEIEYADPETIKFALENKK